MILFLNSTRQVRFQYNYEIQLTTLLSQPVNKYFADNMKVDMVSLDREKRPEFYFWSDINILIP